MRIGNHFFLVIPHLGNCRSSLKNCCFSLYFRCLKRSLHLLNIRHRPPDHLCRHFQAKFVIRLQKNISCLAKSLTDSTVRRLPEITALSMFRMCPSGKDRDLHVGKRRAGQYANVFFFFKMCENQSLPVPCKHVFTACGKKLTAAARFPRLDQKVYFCIMAKRFKVSHTFYRFCNGFFIYNTSGTKFHRYVKTVPDHFF